MILAQVTDTHIATPGRGPLGGLDTAGRLAACVSRVAALDPPADAVALTGDLVDEGTDDEYAHLRALIAPLPMPVYLIPGNHDARAPMRRVFADHAYLPKDGPFLHYVVEDWPLRLVALDTLVPGAPGGALCEARLAWLEACLGEAPERPTAILMHHPPIETGIVHMDRMNCAGAEALGAVVARNPQVERILCGHVHRPIQVRWNGTVVSIAPSPAFQVALDLDPGAPACWTEEPPAFQVHVWRPGLGLVSHLAYVGDFGPPRRFPHAL